MLICVEHEAPGVQSGPGLDLRTKADYKKATRARLKGTDGNSSPNAREQCTERTAQSSQNCGRGIQGGSMILGIGTDITTIDRVRRGYARFGERWARRILAGDELPLLPGGERSFAFLAGRWAAKEACAKALGTGFALGIGPSHICVFNNALGAPYLALRGPAKERMLALGVTAAHISLSHDTLSAVAFVVLEGELHGL